MKKVIAVMTGLFLLMAVAALAQAPKAKATTASATGTISSIDEGTLVLSHKVKGKEEQTTFMMNASTKREGDLKTGEKVDVHYRVEDGQNVATVVKVMSTKMASSSKKK
jgi:TolA-binding protein